MATLSVAIGLINLFPVPMLDGGHLLFYGIEALRGRPLGDRAQDYAFRIGFALLLSLFLFATLNNLNRLPVFNFLTRLFSLIRRREGRSVGEGECVRNVPPARQLVESVVHPGLFFFVF